MIYVITSLIDGHDNLRPPLCPEPGARFLCFTNNPLQPACGEWGFRPVHDAGHPARTARVPKILPHLMLPEDCDYSIWHDANFMLNMRPSEVVGKLLRFDDWSAHKHPARDCIYREADILLSEKIGTAALVESEVARYRALGHPQGHGHGTGAGLWANGLLVRRHTPRVAALNELWWKMYAEGCERDQLSFPVARRILEVPLNTIQEDVFHSPYMRFYWHAAWKDNADNVPFRPERERISQRIERLKRAAGEGGYGWKRY